MLEKIIVLATRSSFLFTLGIFIAVAILINVLLDNPVFSKLQEQAEFEMLSNQPEQAEQTYFRMIQQDSLRVSLHYDYISTHFLIPERTKVGKNKYEYRDDRTIQAYYYELTQSPDSTVADIGSYGSGLIQIHFNKYASAIAEFQQVKNKKLPYLNNSLGNAYRQLDSALLAEIYFRKEIDNGGNLAGAWSNLVQLLFDEHRAAELDSYLKDPEAKKYFPSKVERSIYFKSFQPVNYAINLFKRIFSGFSLWGAIAALLIMGSWIMYLRKLDIFEIEKWKHVIVTVCLGMLFSFLTYPLSDFDNLIFGFRLNGGLLNDFFYCVIGIGAIEEFVKIVPLLLMIRFTKAVNEPFDYIAYASLSALGFAFVENLIYFTEGRLHIIHGRAMTAVVSHMFDSSIIAYGIILNKYKWHRNPFLNFLLFFALASVSHGFYDFWLINESASTFSFFTFIFLLVSMYMWNSFKNNALNHSDFFDKDKSINNEKLRDYLLYSLAGVLLFEYLALAINFSPGVANRSLLSAVFSGSYLILFLTGNLSRFSLIRGEWAAIRYWETGETIDYKKAVGMELKLSRFTENEFTQAYLPNTGAITRRVIVNFEPDWYLVKLDRPEKNEDYLADTVLIRSKDQSEQIEKGNRRIIAFFLVPTGTDLEKETLKRTDFKFCGWATTK